LIIPQYPWYIKTKRKEQILLFIVENEITNLGKCNPIDVILLVFTVFVWHLYYSVFTSVEAIKWEAVVFLYIIFTIPL
jgi:hypothetical protein